MAEQLPSYGTEELEEVNPQPQQGLNFGYYLRMLRRKWELIVATTGITTFTAALVSFLDPYTYVGSFLLLVEPITSESKLAEPSTLVRTGGVPNENLFSLDYPTNLAFLNSPGMKLKIAEAVQPQKTTRTRSVSYIWKDLRDNLSVERVSLSQSSRDNTKLFQVKYEGKDPELVELTLQVAADVFVKYSAEERKTDIKAGVNFIDQQLPNLQEKQEELQSQQQQIREQYELIEPTSRGQELFNQVNTIDNEQSSIQAQLSELKTLYATLKQQLNLTPEQALVASTLSQNPIRQGLIAQLQEIESQIATQSTIYNSNTPQIQDLEDKKQNIVQLLNNNTQKILNENSIYVAQNSPILTFQDGTRIGLINKLIDTANQIEMLESRDQILTVRKQLGKNQAEKMPAVIRQYNDLEQKIALNQEIINRLLTQRETLKVEASQDLPWELLSEPTVLKDADGNYMGAPPERTKKLLAGFMGGLLLGVGAAFILEKRQDIFFSVADIKDSVSLPILTEIPVDDGEKILPMSEEKQNVNNIESDIVQGHPIPLHDEQEQKHKKNQGESSFIEAFKSLYAKLCFIYTNPHIRSLVISSIESGDGQSTIAYNLAKIAANTGKKVLLIDANLTQPHLHTWVGLSNYKGLIDLLTNQIKLDEVIQRSPQQENLFVLTAGVPLSDSPKQLWSANMEHLMAQLQAQYDLVIYDPPHFDVAETGFLASQTDGILLVVTVGKTSQSLVQKTVADIENMGISTIGILANNLS